MNNLDTLKKCLMQYADPLYATKMSRFYKTGPGDYAEQVQFMGIRVPILRKIIQPFINLDNQSLDHLLSSFKHEEKMSAVMILVSKYQQTTESDQLQVYQYYAKNRHKMSNWDLVDCSAAAIVGHHHYHFQQTLPQAWVLEKDIWARRVVIVASHYYIKQDHFNETFNLVQQVFNDKHDLIHKAAGWMLREVGKRSIDSLHEFLEIHVCDMPRTTLRYAIEHMTPQQRQYYLQRS